MAMFSRKASRFRETMAGAQYSQQLETMDQADLLAQEAIKQWEINKEEVTFVKEIGQGAFGSFQL